MNIPTKYFFITASTVLLACPPEGEMGGTETLDTSSSFSTSSGAFEDFSISTLSPTSGASPFCGDGYVNDNEECDDGLSTCFDYYCENDCIKCLIKRYVFVTSITKTGNLGGFDGADGFCNDLAQKNPIIFKRKFRAWLSTPNVDAKLRFQRGNGPYYRLDGVIVTVTGEDFVTNSNLIHSISSDEDGLFRDSFVFTNTLPDGTAISETDCENWTNDGISYYTFVGNSDKLDSRWTFDTEQSSCARPKRIYCIEEAI